MPIDPVGMKIGALQGMVRELEVNNEALMNMLSVIAYRSYPAPLVITERDVVAMPRSGRLTIHTDQETGSVQISFNVDDHGDSGGRR